MAEIVLVMAIVLVVCQFFLFGVALVALHNQQRVTLSILPGIIATLLFVVYVLVT